MVIAIGVEEYHWRMLLVDMSIGCLQACSGAGRGGLNELQDDKSHELEPPHCTTRTEDIEVGNGSGTDICGVRTCNSACPHACTTNEHTFGVTLIPLRTPIES